MVGDIVLPAVYGRNRKSGKMVMPLREMLGLHGNRPMSPVVEDRLCHLAVRSSSYACAAEVAGRFGISTDDSQIQRLVQCIGKRAEEQSLRRVSAAFDPSGREDMLREAQCELKGERFSMALMLDGLMLRSRGEAWGLKPASCPGERAVWHELKAGLVIRIPESQAGKGELPKFYVASAGGPESIGRKLYAEALRRGLHKAKRVYVIADGAVWIWRVAEKYFPGSVEELDFYHASEHLWTLARDIWGDEKAAREWVVPLLGNLKRRGGGELLSILEELLEVAEAEWGVGECQVLARETAYFQEHSSRLCYPKAKRNGFPLGSGAMESACSQIQGRFKRPGQFWSKTGERNLMALDLAWRNRDWNELWARGA